MLRGRTAPPRVLPRGASVALLSKSLVTCLLVRGEPPCSFARSAASAQRACTPGPSVPTTPARWRRRRFPAVSFLKSLFLFQAEDGFRDLTVTGVQTCALPIYDGRRVLPPRPRRGLRRLFRRHESRRRRRRYLGRRAVVGVAEFRPVPRAGQRPDPRDVRIDRKSVV